MKNDPESLLAVRARSDSGAFAEMFDRFYPRVFTYLRYRCNDDATADDLAAQVFEKLLDRLPRFNPERGRFAPWLFTIARNTANDHWRWVRRRRQVPLDLAEPVPAEGGGPEAGLIACEEEEVLLAALGRLDERERDVLSLKFTGQFTNREIARLTGLGESHVGVLIFRGVGKLRRTLEKDHE